MKKVAILLLLTFLAVEVRSQDSRTEYNFLRLPVSAHAAALGGDNVSIIEELLGQLRHSISTMDR